MDFLFFYFYHLVSIPSSSGIVSRRTLPLPLSVHNLRGAPIPVMWYKPDYHIHWTIITGLSWAYGTIRINELHSQDFEKSATRSHIFLFCWSWGQHKEERERLVLIILFKPRITLNWRPSQALDYSGLWSNELSLWITKFRVTCLPLILMLPQIMCEDKRPQ